MQRYSFAASRSLWDSGPFRELRHRIYDDINSLRHFHDFKRWPLLAISTTIEAINPVMTQVLSVRFGGRCCKALLNQNSAQLLHGLELYSRSLSSIQNHVKTLRGIARDGPVSIEQARLRTHFPEKELDALLHNLRLCQHILEDGSKFLSKVSRWYGDKGGDFYEELDILKERQRLAITKQSL